MTEILRLKLTDIIEPELPARDKIDPTGLEELAGSLQNVGLIHAICVKRFGDKYEIEAGHRRYLAARLLGWTEILTKVVGDTDHNDLHLVRAHENLMRENLNPLEEAKQVHLIVYKSAAGIAKAAAMINKSEAWIERRLDIMQYPDDVKEALGSGKINMAVAAELAKCTAIEYRGQLIDAVFSNGASATTVKGWIEDAGSKKYIDHMGQNQHVGTMQTLDMGVTYIDCVFCNEKHKLQDTRHVWMCANAIKAYMELVDMVNEQRAALEAKEMES